MIGAFGFLLALVVPSLGDRPEAKIEVPFEPTPPQVVEDMLKLAKVTEADVVYDLGCGDGRIVIAAAQKLKARGFGVDLDTQRIEECKENAKIAGVADRVQFKVGDIMETDLSPATVVTLYLLDEVNLMLRPKLFRELKPGTRVVSHAFHMADWKSDKAEHPPKARNDVIYLWIIPAPVGGVWQWTSKTDAGETQYRLELTQQFQVVQGRMVLPDSKTAKIADATLTGPEFAFTATVPDGKRRAKVTFKGTIEGDTIKGTQQWQSGSKAGAQEWVAKRNPVDIVGSWRVKVEASPEPLDGVLRLEKKDGALKASYVADKDKKEIALPGFSSWGTSIYFNIPAGEATGPIFSGSLTGDSGNGKITIKDREEKAVWTAQRGK
jgi:SAM-dependent methyltransferase